MNFKISKYNILLIVLFLIVIFLPYAKYNHTELFKPDMEKNVSNKKINMYIGLLHL